MLELKIYCENGSLTKDIRKLKKEFSIKIIYFPFENFTKKATEAKKPSGLTCGNQYIGAGSDIRIGYTESSPIFDQIKSIVGPNSSIDAKHIDTAYKEKCFLFITPDKDDILSKKVALEELTGIKFFYTEELSLIKEAIKKYYQKTSS